MKAVSIALWLAVAGAAVPAAHAAETGKAWSMADAEEHDAIISNHYVPLANATNAAMQLITSDAPQACVKAKEAKVRFDATDAAFTALKVRLTAEGKDLSLMGELNGRLEQIRPGMPKFVEAMCEAPALLTDPKDQAEFQRITRVVQPYLAAMTEATQAMAERDMPRTCASLARARVALKDVDAYVVEIREKYRNDPQILDVAQSIQNQSVGWKARIAEVGADCPAL